MDFPVSLGTHHFRSKPEDPMVLFMLRIPGKLGRPRRDQYWMGRFELIGTLFSGFERNIGEPLNRVLVAAGFDSARAIAAITVNRWAHGYAYEYDSLFDPHWGREERPSVIGRKRLDESPSLIPTPLPALIRRLPSTRLIALFRNS